MEKLAHKFASYISLSLGYDDEKEAVIAYGLTAIIQVSATILLVLLLGILAGVLIESLIVCFSVALFRKYSGGAHAETAEFCTCFSAVYCTLTAFLSKRLLSMVYSTVPMAAAIILVFILSFVTVYKLAPVDTPNKPIRTAKKRRRMRVGSFTILTICFLLSVIFFVLSPQFNIFKSYGIGLLFGIAWQTFTLTHLGSRFVHGMNYTFMKGKEV